MSMSSEGDDDERGEARQHARDLLAAGELPVLVLQGERASLGPGVRVRGERERKTERREIERERGRETDRETEREVEGKKKGEGNGGGQTKR